MTFRLFTYSEDIHLFICLIDGLESKHLTKNDGFRLNISSLKIITVVLISNLSYNLVLDLFRFAEINAMVPCMLKSHRRWMQWESFGFLLYSYRSYFNWFYYSALVPWRFDFLKKPRAHICKALVYFVILCLVAISLPDLHCAEYKARYRFTLENTWAPCIPRMLFRLGLVQWYWESG